MLLDRTVHRTRPDSDCGSSSSSGHQCQARPGPVAPGAVPVPASGTAGSCVHSAHLSTLTGCTRFSPCGTGRRAVRDSGHGPSASARTSGSSAKRTLESATGDHPDDVDNYTTIYTSESAPARELRPQKKFARVRARKSESSHKDVCATCATWLETDAYSLAALAAALKSMSYGEP